MRQVTKQAETTELSAGHTSFIQEKCKKWRKALKGTNSNVKIHLLLRQPLNPRAVVQNYEKIPGQRGMEIELKATVHIMGAVWYRPVYIKELTPHSFFVQYVFYIIQNKVCWYM